MQCFERLFCTLFGALTYRVEEEKVEKPKKAV